MPSPGQPGPVRTCVACRTRRPQAELVRVARTPEGPRLDPRRRLPGRGAYVCPDRPGCREVKKLRRFARAEAEGLATTLTAWAEANAGDNTERSGPLE